MVRTYKKKTTRKSWSVEHIKQAVDAVLNKTMSYRRAAGLYGIPYSTLERYVVKQRNGEMATFSGIGNFKPVLSAHEEDELVRYANEIEKLGLDLTTIVVRKLAYQLAEKYSKIHNFNRVKKVAGVDWLKGFMKRQPELSKRLATSAGRAKGCRLEDNKVAVDRFYSLLGDIYSRYNFKPDRIYNCDEKGISCVSKTIFGETGQHIGLLSAAERGQMVIVELCFNAAGTYMPPMLIFPRTRIKQELDEDCSGNDVECKARGWMTAVSFMTWFRRFVIFSGASMTNPVLLLLDGRIIKQAQNIESLQFARKNGVVILCCPPYSTHKLQPLDVGFMKPLSVGYDRAHTDWLRSHPERIITTFQISEIFAEAYIHAATKSVAVDAFKKCGIWPFRF